MGGYRRNRITDRVEEQAVVAKAAGRGTEMVHMCYSKYLAMYGSKDRLVIVKGR